MRNTSWWLAGSLALMALGCTGTSGSFISPDLASAPGSLPQMNSAAGSIGDAYLAGSTAEAALGIYSLDIDPTTLTATARLKEVRHSQANDDLYLLSINNFLNASSFQITSVAVNGTDLELGYEVSHPFPAPNNVTGAPNAFSNRSDLGVAGRVLFLIDVPSAAGNTYFTDRIANTETVTNADGYYSPAGMITYSGTANTFPYRQLVDEDGNGSRVGVSNGGNPAGNFGTDGWTRAKYGAGNNGWTGYGVLHQGQTSANMIAFDLNALTGGLSVDVAVIAKYNDPRGGTTAAQKRANRLPGATADHTQFAYRMPHGALDVASIPYVRDNGPGFTDTGISGTELEIHVLDWDANGTPSGQAAGSLELDPVVTNIEAAEAGAPTLSVCIPGVLGDATVTADVTGTPTGTGVPGNPLVYSDTITKSFANTAGTYTGMVMAVDPEDGALLPVPLNENVPPGPLGSNLPRPVAYQAFTVDVGVANDLPTGDWSLVATTIFDGQSTAVNVSNVVDGDSPNFDIEIDWDNGSGFVSVATGLTPGAGPFGPYASPVYTLANPVVGETRTIAVRLRDSVSNATNLANNVGGAVLTIDPFTCTPSAVVVSADFESIVGFNAWISGNVSTPPAISGSTCFGTPSDGENFTRCTTAIAGMAGFKYHTGSDNAPGACTSFIDDYASNADYNIVSPSFSLAGRACAELQFSSFKNTGGATANFNIYTSVSSGPWTLLQTYPHAVGLAETLTVDLTPVAGNADVKLRFQLRDPGTYIAFGCWTPSLFPFAGWGIDNVIVRANP